MLAMTFSAFMPSAAAVMAAHHVSEGFGDVTRATSGLCAFGIYLSVCFSMLIRQNGARLPLIFTFWSLCVNRDGEDADQSIEEKKLYSWWCLIDTRLDLNKKTIAVRNLLAVALTFQL